MLIAENIDMTTREGIAGTVFDDLVIWLALYDPQRTNDVISDAGRMEAVRLAQKYGIRNFHPIYN